MAERGPGRWRRVGDFLAAYSYGAELIERALPYQLKAKTKLEFGPDGVRCLIVAPIRVQSQGKDDART